MILNIRDHRTRPNRWKSVNVVMEPTCQDNGVADADQAGPAGDGAMICEERAGISLAEAIEWGMQAEAQVTLYLYDEESEF
jgi:hypothetical protein